MREMPLHMIMIAQIPSYVTYRYMSLAQSTVVTVVLLTVRSGGLRLG